MLSPFPLRAPQEPPPQPPGAGHGLHQPRLFHLRGAPQRSGPGSRRSPPKPGTEPGRDPALPQPRRNAGPAALGGGTVGGPAPLRDTEPVPWAPSERPQSGPAQETQVSRADGGHAGAGPLLAACGRSPEPAGAAEQRGHAGPEPARPGAAAEAIWEAGSAGGPGSSGRRAAAGQDLAALVPCEPSCPRQPLPPAQPCSALLPEDLPSFQHSSRGSSQGSLCCRYPI